MLELEKIFLLVRFFSRISCSKGLKVKISCFFLYFFCLTPLRLEYFRIRKIASFLTLHRLKKYKNICVHRASRMEWKRGKCWKLLIFEGKLQGFFSYLSEMETVSMFYNFLILVLFTAYFYHFMLWRYLNSSMTSFSSDILLLFPNSNDLNSRVPR